MIIFVKDRPIRVLDYKQDTYEREIQQADNVIDTRLKHIKEDDLIGHILLLNATITIIEKLFGFLSNSDLSELQSIAILTKRPKTIQEKIESLFSVVKAAGGIVLKDKQLLLMYRRGVWDLPKGKLDSGEKSKTAALRETEEETGVKTKLIDKICTTYHTYWQDGEAILKRTKWYLMECIDDKKMKPQKEEGIEKIGWYSEKEAKLTLINSFSSIRYVVDEYLKKRILLDI